MQKTLCEDYSYLRQSSKANKVGQMCEIPSHMCPTLFALEFYGRRPLALDDLDRIDLITRLSVAHRITFSDGAKNIYSLRDLSKHSMFTVQMRCRSIRNEELRAVCIRASIRHRQNALTVMLEGKRPSLIIELIPWAASAGSSWITTLSHETADHTMKGRSIV